MNNRKKHIILQVLFVAVLLVGYLLYHYMWDTQSVPKGELLKEVYSPKKEYKANVYSGIGGATVDSSVLVEIINQKTKQKRNIYWEYHCDDVKIKWLSEREIQINNKRLNVKTDVYDFRH